MKRIRFLFPLCAVALFLGADPNDNVDPCPTQTSGTA